jgi:L-threonylcarbamoyladenylate synthase
MVIKTEKKLQITKAVNLLRAGKLVAFPTETVYGLGADASNEMAVHQIFRVKERPLDHPLIVHIAKHEQLAEWAKNISPKALTLARAFWPGPLTLILKKQPHVLHAVTGGQETIGLRIPKHPMALALLSAFGGGIAAPSANMYTRISPTSVEGVAESFLEKIDLILDGGTCEIGLESTILDMTRKIPRLLRPGMITVHAINEVLGMSISHSPQEKPRASGMHHLHYAPLTHTLLMGTNDIDHFLKMLLPEELPVLLLMQSSLKLPAMDHIFYVKMPSEAREYAHELYRVLRSVDREQLKHIIIEDVPDTIEWQAIRDRLQKASGRKHDHYHESSKKPAD